ncbi:ABC transporter permease [Mameliella sediminis]|uniref:ABC transporter permease n=1 Tax=Mameliella sediminis TaxID=2836866 RepID=UPI001C489D40|nr:ABC transporter permease [Mameliella sediminis]MBV7395200.1 ABC transporter permease [Mameliella sediminis]
MGIPARPEHARNPLVIVVSLAGLVAVWWLGALSMADPDILPTPQQVWTVIAAEAASGELWLHTGMTLSRVIAAFVFAMGIGSVLGVLLGLYPRLNTWVDPWVVVFLNLPALVVIVLAYLWIGLNEVAAIVAVSVNKTAMVVVTVREGVRARDRQVGEMAQVFGLSRWMRFRHVLLPQLAPFLSTAVRNGLAVIWKIVLVVEFLGRGNGVGFQIHLYFQLFDTATVLAYSLSFVAVMLLIEYLVVQTSEAQSARWRRLQRAAA